MALRNLLKIRKIEWDNILRGVDMNQITYRARVLLIEDDDVDAEWVSRLVGEEMELVRCSTAAEARRSLSESSYQCILADYGLPDVEGEDFIAECTELGHQVVVLTGHSAASQAVLGMKAGARDYLTKDDLKKDVLLRALRNAVESEKLQREVRERDRLLEEAHQIMTERDERISLILDSIREAFWIASNDRRVFHYLSPQVAQVWQLNAEELSGAAEAVVNRICPTDRPTLEGIWASDEPAYEVQYRMLEPNGRQVWLREKASRTEKAGVVLWVGVTEDITRSKELEDQFFHAQKMEALGRLAGGLAHDFNNILTGILGYSDYVRIALGKDHELYEEISEVCNGGYQAKKLIKQLLDFSHKPQFHEEYCCAAQGIRQTESLLKRTLSKSVTLQVDLPGHPLNIGLSQSKLEQVIMNLAVNAADAMPQGGKITITGRVTDSWVLITVKDTGQGIPEELKERVAEPYFSTKKGKGTGLGLSTVFGIVSEAGGRIELASSLGHGTEFRIEFPRKDDSAKSLKIQAPDLIEDLPSTSSGTLLVIEDEKNLRDLFKLVLENRGHQVIVASDGLDAIMKMEVNQRPLTGIISDVLMPGLSGPETIEKLRPMVGTLPVLYISGFSSNKFGKTVRRGHEKFVSKPFSIAEFLSHVDETFDFGQTP